jgi:hypothetical protein
MDLSSTRLRLESMARCCSLGADALILERPEQYAALGTAAKALRAAGSAVDDEDYQRAARHLDAAKDALWPLTNVYMRSLVVPGLHQAASKLSLIEKVGEIWINGGVLITVTDELKDVQESCLLGVAGMVAEPERLRNAAPKP